MTSDLDIWHGGLPYLAVAYVKFEVRSGGLKLTFMVNTSRRS